MKNGNCKVKCNEAAHRFAGVYPELVEGAQNDIFDLALLIDEKKSLNLLAITSLPTQSEIPSDSVPQIPRNSAQGVTFETIKWKQIASENMGNYL